MRIQNVLARLFGTKIARKSFTTSFGKKLNVEGLEERAVPAALTRFTPFVPSPVYAFSLESGTKTAEPGQNVVLANDLLFGGRGGTLNAILVDLPGDNVVGTRMGIDYTGRFGIPDGRDDVVLNGIDVGDKIVFVAPAGIKMSAGYAFVKITGTVAASAEGNFGIGGLTVSGVNVGKTVNYGSNPTFSVAPKTDLSVYVDAPAEVQKADGSYVVTYKVTNFSGVPAKGAKLVAEIPANATLAGKPGGSVSSNAITFNLGTIHPGQTVTKTVKWSTSSTPDDAIVKFVASVESKTLDGDTRNNVYADQTKVGIPYVPQLSVATKSIGSYETAVKNQKNVNLARVEMYGGASQGNPRDILLTGMKFAATQGNLVNGQNYMLWVDTDMDGTVDTILQDGVSAQSGLITFDRMIGGGYVVPAGMSVAFEVHANISASLASDTLAIDLATDRGDYIMAERLNDGSSLSGIVTNGVGNGQIVVNATATPKVYNLVSQGTLYVTQSTTPVRSRQLLGGTVSDSVFRLTFRAENEDIEVTLMHFGVLGTGANSIDRLDLYKAGDTTPFASATIGGTGTDQVPTTFDGQPVTTFTSRTQSRQLVVKKGQDLDVIVYARMKSDEQGAISGGNVQLVLDPGSVMNVAAGIGAIHARGALSSNNLAGNDGDALPEGEVIIGSNVAAPNRAVVGTQHVTVLSKIVNVTNANPDANGSNVPTGVSSIGQWKFTAAANNNTLNGLNKVQLWKLTVQVDANNVLLATNGFQLYNKADTSVKVAGRVLNLNGTPYTGGATITGSFLVEIDLTQPGAEWLNAVIDQGNNGTFVLEGNVLNSKISGPVDSSLQMTMRLDGGKFSWADRDTSSRVFDAVDLPDLVIKSTNYQS